MKLNDVRPNVETSGELDEQFFSVADQGMLFDILRSKMYSNPILAICREISCNARDAHREVGKSDEPVHIHIPTSLEPYYKIKDFGPGISPARMANVFIKYMASTKREDNVQTGGFGLGAKTPFSYADTFAITTNVDGVQYSYACFIDESKVGKLMLTSEAPTTEPNGTEIKIPVQPKNFNEFATWTEQACRHWTVKPVVKGQEIHWTKIEPMLDGKNWAITRCHDWNRVAMMVIDGIEYPLPIDTLRKFADAKLIDCSKGNFVMYFGVGDLALSATRENIFLDEKTQSMIRRRLEDIYQEVRQRVVDKINSFPNLWDANVYFRQELKQGFSNSRFLGTLAWNGVDLHEDDHLSTNCTVFHFTKGKWTRKHGDDPNKLTRSTTQYLAFKEKSAIYVNDLTLKEPTPRHVRKAFDDDPNLVCVQVVVPNDTTTLDVLKNLIHLDKMNYRLLSSITKASARAYTPASSRVLVFKFDERACSFRQTSYGAMDEDDGDKILCMITRDSQSYGRRIQLKNKTNFDLRSLKYLAEKNPKKKFYGIDIGTAEDRIKEDFSDLDSLDDFLERKVNKSGIDFVSIKFSNSKRGCIDHTMLRNFNKLKSLIEDSNSTFLKRFQLHENVNKMLHGDLHLLEIYEHLNGEIPSSATEQFVKDHPEFDIDKLDDEYSKHYPLLEHIRYYSFDEVGQAMAQYINLIDKS